MKKYIFIIILSIITLANVNWASAQPATNGNDACNNKKNGDACSYSKVVSTGSNAPTTQTTNGYCDRNGGGVLVGGENLYCNKEVNGWKDCFTPDDACEQDGKLGVCDAYNKCDTTKKPPGNPGGSTSATCGSSTCTSGQVCVNQGNPPRPTCTANASTPDGKCNGQTCASNQVCVNQGNPPRPTCTANASTPGTPANNTPTDATAPQTVGFINPSRFNSITELIAGVINALLGILGAITVAVLVASGFKYMIGSNPGEVAQALDGIRNAIVGLMIIMGAFLITQYVISALAV
jgi:hypothetical protein